MGIAIPHCKSDAVTKAGLAAMVVKDGVDFESLDGTPAKIIFLIAAPNTEDNVHLQVLSKLSVMLMDEQFTNSLINAGSVDEFLNIIDSAEKAKDEKEAAKEAKEPVEVKKDDVFIVAVTACPTGIAHTYMAAEAIEKKAKELGYQVKVETRGSAGAKMYSQMMRLQRLPVLSLHVIQMCLQTVLTERRLLSVRFLTE